MFSALFRRVCVCMCVLEKLRPRNYSSTVLFLANTNCCSLLANTKKKTQQWERESDVKKNSSVARRSRSKCHGSRVCKVRVDCKKKKLRFRSVECFLVPRILCDLVCVWTSVCVCICKCVLNVHEPDIRFTSTVGMYVYKLIIFKSNYIDWFIFHI